MVVVVVVASDSEVSWDSALRELEYVSMSKSFHFLHHGRNSNFITFRTWSKEHLFQGVFLPIYIYFWLFQASLFLSS